MEAVDAVLKRRDRLLDAVASATGLGVWDGESVSRAAESAARLVPSAQYDALYKTLAALAGREPSRAEVRDLCWAVAADTAALQAGVPVRAGVLPPGESDVTVQFLAALRRRAWPGQVGFPVKYRVRILAGPGAPARFEFEWSSRYVVYFASLPAGLGFAGRPRGSRPPAGRKYQHFSTLVGMRTVLSVEPADRGVAVRGSRCPPGLREYNRALTEMRWRNGWDCPFSFDHHCHECPKGQGSCAAACRPEDLQTRVCVACGAAAEHDPAWPAVGMCLRCVSLGRKPKT